MAKRSSPASSLVLWCALAGTTSAQPPGPVVLLLYDLEGLTDVTAPGTTVGSDGYEPARRSLVEDVNAAIAGLLEAGASEVVLVDGHGSGNPEPDYPLEHLPEGARHEMREAPLDPYLAVLEGDYDAVVAIGMHAGSGRDGFLAHTVLAHTRWIANGIMMNESMILAAFAARAGAPLILVTGDDALEREVEAFSPRTQYVTVKRALAYGAAEARPREQVSSEIRAAATEALRAVDSIPPWSALEGRPLDNELGYRTSAQTELASLYPGASVLNDRAVALPADDLLDAYLAYRALASYTFLAHMRRIVEIVGELDDGDAILRRVGERMPPSSERTFEPTARAPESTMFARHGSR